MKVFAPDSAINALKEIIADNQDKEFTLQVMLVQDQTLHWLLITK